MSLDRPNLLYIFTDQQFAGAMSCAGNPELSTPAMDRLAAEGVRFDRAYCAFPLCTPSRGVMFSGRWPHRNGARWNEQRLTDEAREQGIGNVLGQAGYACAYAGKWHVPWCSPMEQGHGFETINDFDDPHIAADVLSWLEQPRAGPFFAVASFDNPHNICEYAQHRPLAWGPVPEPPSLAACPLPPPNHAPPTYEPACLAHAGRPRDATLDDWRRYRWTYNRLVEKVDAEIGNLLEGLDRLGLTESTLVLFASDHGDMLGAHGMGQKLPLYEESARVPFILRWPGRAAAGRVDSDSLVQAGLDLYPTLCDAAGVETPFQPSGRSVLSLLGSQDAAAGWRDHVVAVTRLGQAGPQGRMVRTARFKYVAWEWGANREQLFDLDADPGELSNLAPSARFTGVLQEHRDLLRTWCREEGDDFGYHYTHPRVPFLVPGDTYAPDAGGLPEGFGG